MTEYFSGEKLYGDDFSKEQITAWYRDEEYGYYNLGGSDRESYQYGYHALNWRHGFRHLPDRLLDTRTGRIVLSPGATGK